MSIVEGVALTEPQELVRMRKYRDRYFNIAYAVYFVMFIVSFPALWFAPPYSALAYNRILVMAIIAAIMVLTYVLCIVISSVGLRRYRALHPAESALFQIELDAAKVRRMRIIKHPVFICIAVPVTGVLIYLIGYFVLNTLLILRIV